MFITYGYVNADEIYHVYMNRNGLELLKGVISDKIKEYAENNEIDNLCDVVHDYTQLTEMVREYEALTAEKGKKE